MSDRKVRGKPPGVSADKFSRLDLGPALRDRKTTTDHIANALRAAIFDGQFEDGEEPNQVELAAHFNVSRVPIREALRLLQAEGLVDNIAHRRSIVVGLELRQILEFIELRALIEGHLLEKAGPELSERDIRRLEKLCDEMDAITRYDHNWVVKNWEFHRSLYQHSDSSAAIDMAEQMHLKVERYVRRSGQGERLENAASEHREILDAVKRGDFATARTLMHDHVLNNGEQIKRSFARTVADES